MEKLLDRISDDTARKELKQFLIVGYVCSAISLFLFGWLAIVGIGAGARAVLLSYHPANKTRASNMKLRVAAIALLVFAVAVFGLFLTLS